MPRKVKRSRAAAFETAESFAPMSDAKDSQEEQVIEQGEGDAKKGKLGDFERTDSQSAAQPKPLTQFATRARLRAATYPSRTTYSGRWTRTTGIRGARSYGGERNEQNYSVTSPASSFTSCVVRAQFRRSRKFN